MKKKEKKIKSKDTPSICLKCGSKLINIKKNIDVNSGKKVLFVKDLHECSNCYFTWLEDKLINTIK